ncbi:MAG: hypothetical protein ACFHU9_07705 [Fluviicola sp.]
MLNRIEFSDLYKFLTSVGLIFIAAAFLLPWLFMKEGIGIAISNSEYNDLIIESKNLTDKRIALSSFVISSIPWISGALFLGGGFLVGFGLFHWKKKQNRVDETEELNLTELRTKIQRLNTSEIREKAEQEVTEEISSTSDITENEIKVEQPDIETLKNNLIDMEGLFFEKIIAFNTFDFKPNSNVKIVDGREVDILLHSYNIKRLPDVLIEIKYLQNKLSMQLIRDSYKKFRETHSKYVVSAKRNAKMKFIIVYKEDIANLEEINRFVSACNLLEKEINYQALKFFVLTESQAKDFDIKQLLN